MDCDLYFCDLTQLGGPTGWRNNYKNYESKAVFKNVQTQSFRIKNLVTGVAEFIPINFKKDYFSVMKVQLQSAMLDYKFRIEQSDKVTFKSVGEFLFGSENGQLPKSVQIEQARVVYSAYKSVVSRMFEKLSTLY